MPYITDAWVRPSPWLRSRTSTRRLAAHITCSGRNTVKDGCHSGRSNLIPEEPLVSSRKVLSSRSFPLPCRSRKRQVKPLVRREARSWCSGLVNLCRRVAVCLWGGRYAPLHRHSGISRLPRASGSYFLMGFHDITWIFLVTVLRYYEELFGLVSPTNGALEIGSLERFSLQAGPPTALHVRTQR
jgi:hypothetical protein